MTGEYIKVHILDVPYSADCEYTYYVPFDFRSDVALGSTVVVPFGKGDRLKSAIVTNENTVVTAQSFSSISGYALPIASDKICKITVKTKSHEGFHSAPHPFRYFLRFS